MTTMVTELYDALLDAGASADKARRAAEALANYDDRFNRVERQIAGLDHKMEAQISGVDHKVGDLERKIEAKISNLDHKVDRVKSDLEKQIGGVKSDLELQIGTVKSDVSLLKWMLGAVLALLIPMFLKQFTH